MREEAMSLNQYVEKLLGVSLKMPTEAEPSYIFYLEDAAESESAADATVKGD